MKRAITFGVMAGALCVMGWVVQAQQAPRQTPRVLIDSLAGRDSYEQYCAACHGRDGRGNGPVAAALRTRPADLTTLKRRSDGAYPADTVRNYITGTGRELAAHGTTEMPVWGPMFRAFESDVRARERIGNLVAYIETLQLPSTGPRDQGSQLFMRHCASCHGADARGRGPFGELLPHAPPDLTQFTSRNGGVFPTERVYRIIEGRDVPAHVDRDMPVWGSAFRSSPGGTDAATVKARIEAIVRYLEGIQARSL
jgi:mono/diheme cytochrome c family protein